MVTLSEELELLRENGQDSNKYSSTPIPRPLDVSTPISKQFNFEDSIAAEPEASGSWLQFGIRCFNQFLQSNWTGPELEGPALTLSSQSDISKVLALLEIDGEGAYSDCLHPHLLLASLQIFSALLSRSASESAGVWYARALFVWQRVLADSNDRGQGNCPSLMDICVTEYCEALGEFGYLPSSLVSETTSYLKSSGKPRLCQKKLRLPEASLLDTETRAELIVEFLVRLAYYGKTNLITPILSHVTSTLGIIIDVTGVSGIRRQYQTEAFAQMAARVVRTSPRESTSAGPIPSVPVPKALTLAEVDCTTDMLEEVKLSDGTENETELTSELSAIEQCCLIAEGLRHFYSGSSRDELNLEAVHAVAMRIISTSVAKPPSWIAFSMSLLFRSRAEFFRNNTRGRACFQTDALVDQFKDVEPSPAIRLRHIHTTGYPSRWELQRENGVRMMEVGMLMTACEMFKTLKMWPLAMDCLGVAGRKQEALDLLDSLEPLNARLLVSKGDMTGNSEFYHKAWELSNHRSARAMRSLGRFYLRESQLERAAECFELSLEINPLFDEIWFNLGSIYLRLDDSGEAACEHKKKAMNAFVRCVNVNPEHVQGWVNLSAVYSECGLEYIQEAKQAAGEAVKLAPQAWQFWENYTLISARAEDWQNALRGEQKLSLSLNRSDHPDLNMVRMMVVNIKSSALRVRLLGFLEDLVLKNKQTVEILKILTDMYVEFGRFEEAFKTVTCQLKEILGLVGTVGEANSLYSAQDLLTEAIQCLGRMSEMLDSNHLRSIEGITAGIGLTVRSVPRRIAAISGGQDLPQLKTFCDKIQKTVESWSSLAE